MPIDTHTGAVEGMHILPAVDHAIEDGFDGIQIYVNDEILDEHVFAQLVERINNSHFNNIIFHLENFNKIKPEQLNAVERLLSFIPAKVRVQALIHMEYWEESKPIEIKFSQVPRIQGRAVCIENSKTGIFDQDHVVRSLELARSLNTGFVFDIGRILYPNINGKVNEQEVYEFISSIIQRMNPLTDVIHCAGKTDWFKRFRESASAFGATDDITAPLREVLFEFHQNGGVIVFEHEDKQMILDSRENLLGIS